MFQGGEIPLHGVCDKFDSCCVHSYERRMMKILRTRISTGNRIDELSVKDATTILLPFYYQEFMGLGSKFRTHIRNRLKDGEPMFSEIYCYQLKGE